MSQAAGRVRERLAAYYDEFGLGAVPEPSDPLPRFDEERLQLMLDLQTAGGKLSFWFATR